MIVSRIEEFAEAINTRDMAAAMAIAATGVTVLRGDGTSLEGADGLRELLDGLIAAYPDLHLALRRITPFGETVAAAEWFLCGRHDRDLALPLEAASAPASGRNVALTFAAIVYLDDDGRIGKLQLRGDTAGLTAAPATTATASLTPDRITAMVEDYTRAWNSGNPHRVSAHYAETGWISINNTTPHAGRAGVTAMAAGFMAAFPGMTLTNDDLLIDGDRAVFFWTLAGANTGPGGTGRFVNISGYEIWRLDENCRVAESHGYYDNAAYNHQLATGPLAN